MKTHEHLMPPKTVLVRDTDQRAPVHWPAVTDMPCPVCETKTVRWAEAGHVPGYRICDGREAHFFARGTAVRPMLGERSFRWRGLTAAGIRPWDALLILMTIGHHKRNGPLGQKKGNAKNFSGLGGKGTSARNPRGFRPREPLY